MFSLKSRAWQLGLTTGLFLITYLGSLTQTVTSLEYDLFLYILNLQPENRELVTIPSIKIAPQWAVLCVYAMILAVYVRKYTRARTTAVSFLTITVIVFSLLMLELLLAIFSQVYLPVVLPGFIMILVSSIYWVKAIIQKLITDILFPRENISLDDVNLLIEQGELKTALFMLKQTPYSDDLLEVAYELGMRLESNKNWASALNLYHWVSQYDPGLSDFVTRIEELRDNRVPVDLSDLPDSPLETIGHYQLLKKIAKGSTAIVYEAYDLSTHNRVALKVMVTQLDDNFERGRIQHWLREAEIVSQFEHDNIVKIHDAAMQDNTAYIAMDYISGYSMSLRLRRREYITVGECIRISKSVLSALAVAHSYGIVHGDIKPANIMYDDVHDTYIVTDFGAAYIAQKGIHKKESIIVGTPSYMSPEQLEGKKLDGRSDLFSLAVTLYHLLTGHQPFSGESLYHLKQSIIGDEPDVDHLTLPAGLMEVILKALHKKTYMRFADAQQMLSAVEYCETHLLEKMRSNH